MESPITPAFSVERVRNTLPVDEFERRFYVPGRPVIICNVTDRWRARDLWTPQYLRTNFQTKSEGVDQRLVWFDVDEGVFDDDYRLPDVIAGIMSRHHTRARNRWTRLWIAKRGTVTSWHYDGHGVDGYNVQVKGRKRFTIVSPVTPLRCHPFLSIGLDGPVPPAEVIRRDHVWTAVDLNEGEMLYLPRYWFHYVEALDDVNINLNWVRTDSDLAFSSGSAGAKRERECIAISYLMAMVLSRLRRQKNGARGSTLNLFDIPYLNEYGGGQNFEVPRRLFHELTTRRLLSRAVRELMSIGASRRVRRPHESLMLEMNEGVKRSAVDYFEKADTLVRDIDCEPPCPQLSPTNGGRQTHTACD